MILIVSDLHLGKGGKRKDRSSIDDQSLSELLQCIQTIGPELKEVVFLGDTFDAFIEYKYHIPETVIKWTRLAAELQHMKIKVRFFAGNHDRWHGDHIQKTLQVHVQRHPSIVSAEGRSIWMEHGDSAAPNSSLVRFIRYVSDRSWALTLFKIGLPFGLGQQLAAFVSRTFSSFEPNPVTIEGLKSYAFELIDNEPVNLVVMGHCHSASLDRPPATSSSDSPINALYANTGDWYKSRTFVLVSDSVQLCQWTSGGISLLKEEIF